MSCQPVPYGSDLGAGGQNAGVVKMWVKFVIDFSTAATFAHRRRLFLLTVLFKHNRPAALSTVARGILW